MLYYKRILLKLSGEALMGNKQYGIDPERLTEYALQIKDIVELGVQVGIVIGGGNIFRGLQSTNSSIDRVKGDYMGMLSTVINGLAIQSALENQKINAKILTAIRMEPIADFYNNSKSKELLSKGEVIIFSAGTSNPYFTTDTAAALRAIETEADVLLKGTRVNGVFSDDPEKNNTAVKYDQISFAEIFKRKLKIMDLTAITLCEENNLPIVVFDMNTKGNLKKLILGQNVGTLVKK